MSIPNFLPGQPGQLTEAQRQDLLKQYRDFRPILLGQIESISIDVEKGDEALLGLETGFGQQTAEGRALYYLTRRAHASDVQRLEGAKKDLERLDTSIKQLETMGLISVPRIVPIS